MSSNRVREAFLGAQRSSAPSPADLSASALSDRIRVAREAWPGIDVPDEAFAALLGAHAAGLSDDDLVALPVVDLYLALACARGDGKALQALEARYFPGARAVLGRMGLPADQIDDVLQVLRARLLVPESGAPPRILQAAGYGDLAGVVRVAAVRTAHNLRRRDARLDTADESLFDVLVADDDPELAVLKEDQRTAFKAALEEVLTSLEPKERNILRMHLIHALSIDEIGRVYQVHRATAARWLASTREKVDRETRRLLLERLNVSEAEFSSMFCHLASGIDLSFRRLLASSPGGGASRGAAEPAP